MGKQNLENAYEVIIKSEQQQKIINNPDIKILSKRNQLYTYNQLITLINHEQPEIAVFDLDGTLTKTNIISFYMYYLKNNGRKNISKWIKLFLNIPIYLFLDILNRDLFQSYFYRNYYNENYQEIELIADKYTNSEISSLIVKDNINIMNL